LKSLIASVLPDLPSIYDTAVPAAAAIACPEILEVKRSPSS
jgi:hypothetical protein